MKTAEEEEYANFLVEAQRTVDALTPATPAIAPPIKPPPPPPPESAKDELKRVLAERTISRQAEDLCGVDSSHRVARSELWFADGIGGLVRDTKVCRQCFIRLTGIDPQAFGARRMAPLFELEYEWEAAVRYNLPEAKFRHG